MACNSRLSKVLLAGIAIVAASSATAQPIDIQFGTNNDGDGGFTANLPFGDNESHTTLADSVQYSNPNPGTTNSSFLGEFVLDRTDGKAYAFTGVVNFTDDYTDDNNRVGMYFFSDFAEIFNEDEVGALGLIFNTDDGAAKDPVDDNADDRLYLIEGIDLQPIYASTDRPQTLTPYAGDLVGTALTFSAKVSFVGDNIVMSASMATENGEVTNIAPVSFLAADYTGDYFGFVTRARSRNNGVEGDPRSAPWVMDYESFSIVETTAFIPGDTDDDGDIDDADLGGAFANTPGRSIRASATRLLAKATPTATATSTTPTWETPSPPTPGRLRRPVSPSRLASRCSASAGCSPCDAGALKGVNRSDRILLQGVVRRELRGVLSGPSLSAHKSHFFCEPTHA